MTRSEPPRRVDTFVRAVIIATFVLNAHLSHIHDRGGEAVRIEVETLTEAGKPFEHTYRADEIALDDEQASLASEVEIEGLAHRKGEEVRINGKIKGEAEVLCDRCLAATRLPFEVEFDASFIPRPLAAARGENVELLT